MSKLLVGILLGELLPENLTVIGFALWTLVSGFIGALLGAAGKAAGYDCYAAVKERYHKWKYGYEYVDSKLKRKMKFLSNELRKMDYEMGDPVSFSSVDDLYYNWKESLERYETVLQDEFETIIKELEKRGEFDPRLDDEETRMMVFLREIERWEDRWDGNWDSPEAFFNDYSLMTRQKDPRKSFTDDRHDARNALEDLANKIDEVRREIEWENEGTSSEEHSSGR